MLLFILPTFDVMADVFEYPDAFTPETDPSTVISFFDTGEMGQRYETMETISNFDVDGRAAALTLSTRQEHERLVMAIEDGQGGIITVMAFTALENMEPFRPLLEDMLGRMRLTPETE